MRILVAEDDRRLSDLLDQSLTEAGWEVEVAHDGRSAYGRALPDGVPYDVLLLDWMLPEMDGVTVCRRLRALGLTTPVLMLTARGDVRDRIDGLDAGADDYLSKPFDLDELLARLRALVRRSTYGAQAVVEVDDLVIDPGARTVTRAGHPVELSAREFDVLHLLVSRTGQVVSRYTILDEVWDGETDLRSNVIDVHLASIRAKIDRPFGTSTITTVRGAGYRVDPDCRMSRLPLRVRLIAGFGVAMLVLLTAAGAFVYWRVEYALDRGLDTELDQATAVITPLVGPTGRVTAPEAADATGAGWQVVDDNGHVVDSGGTAPTAPLISTDDLDQVGGDALTKDIGKLLPIADKPYRVQVSALDQPGGQFLVVGVRRDHRDEALRELLLQLTLAGLGALAVAAVVGDVLARAALRPVERYRRRAAEIAAGANGLRLEVPEGRDDEVTRLGHTLNDMLAALERSLERERRFVNEASHELRTPLTLLKSRIQLAQRRRRSVEQHEVVLDELAVDVTRLTELADQLLILGATEGAPRSPGSHADVVEIATAVVERHRLAQPEHTDRLILDAADAMTAAIDARALERMLTNLIDNAFTHGAPPVEVRIRAAEPGWCLVEVSDAGPGMSPELMDRAAERFTRSDEARSRPGAGLGLAIVVALARSAGGELRICYGDQHTCHGQQVAEVPCEHSTAMTATVILPRSAVTV